MSLSRRVLARAIAARLAAGDDRTALLQQLAGYLVTEKQTAQLEMIVSDIVRNLAELGTVKARVTVAHPLTADLRKAVEAYVARVENATTVQLEEIISTDQLGGIVVETPNKRFDASVTTQLKRLKNV